ncbi:hypothetical protein BBJ28_00018509 [Nothophytophthora sp. Chile5]|nr:hypothetical protein BBJ28_00018509 [Nothophytophthora sp. Chile5]
MAQYASAASADRSVREHFARVSAEFQQFLTEAAAFYAHLRDVFLKWLQTNRVSRIAAPSAANGAASTPFRPDSNGHSSAANNDAAASIARCRQSLHRCFVFLGDLARYRELHSQKAKKNFAAAESFYHRALAVLPENGNPHNQLAVLATYVEAETVAVYRYCRSLLTTQPFATAEENLALLFERSRQRPLAAPGTLSATSPSSKEKSTFLKSFLHRLTRMHGILFALAMTRGSPTATPGRGSNSGSAILPVYPKDMEAVLFKDLQTLLRAGVVGDALLLKLVVTNIFCIVRALDSQSPSAPLEDALRLATRTISNVMQFLAKNLDVKTKATANGKAGKNPALAGLRLLGPVTVYCDYLRAHPDVLEQLEQLSTRRQQQLPGSDSDATPAGQEAGVEQFASAFLEALAALVNHARFRELYAPLMASGGQLHGQGSLPLVHEQQQLLKENLELRGFAPLEQDVATTKWQDDWALQTPANGSGSAPAMVPLADAEATKLRAWKLYGFAQFLCDGYEGDPLLFCGVTGKFATAPVVGSRSTQQENNSAQSFPSFSLGFFGDSGVTKQQQTQKSQESIFGNGQHGVVGGGEDEDDDFDDEVIVFQPSPALTGMSGSQGTKQYDRYMATVPSPLDALSSAGAFSLRAASPISSAEDQGRMSASSQGSAFGGSASVGGNGAIGSSLGYPSFHTFSDAGGFSSQRLLSGWGSVNGDSNGASLSGGSLGLGFGSSNGGDTGFSMPSTSSSSSSMQTFGMINMGVGRSTFAPMADLAAVERESALYQREGSSLSAFLGSSLSMNQTPMQATPVAPRASARPPPGFAGGSTGNQQQSPQQQPLYSRNTFLNP